MRLLPYLYSAYVEYRQTGKPPVRALVLDYPEDSNVRIIDDEYMFGESMLVCPLTYEDKTSRQIYLPSGNWYDLFTGEKTEGGRTWEMEAAYNRIPVFVREGAIVPLAEPVLCVRNDTVFDMEVRIFGEADGKFVLYSDDFESFDYEQHQDTVILEKHPGEALRVLQSGKSRYRIIR